MSPVEAVFLESVRFRFLGLKELGDKAMAQLEGDDFHWSPDPESNSIATIVRHLHGNMLSRWTEFLTSDGEKPDRDRDGEFDATKREARAELLQLWDEGWACVLGAIESLGPGDLLKEVFIRGQGLSALDAIERQVAHYGYHVGQIVYIARIRRQGDWTTLSIPRGQSGAYKPVKRD